MSKSIDIVTLHDLTKKTHELHESSYVKTTRYHGKYTRSHWDCAAEVCGAEHPWLNLVHYLALSGEGYDIIATMARRAQTT